MTKIKSEGSCYYCKKVYAGSGISRHLTTHLQKLEKENISSKKSYHIRIKGGPYFLHLLVKEDVKLNKLDSFLRQIWLECCGHLSSFEIKGAPRKWTGDFDDFGLNMNSKVSKFFKKGITLDYQYDFGSTTQLEINVLNEYFAVERRGIVLLSRNEPLKILCHSCEEKPATSMCLLWHEDGSMFCKSCAKKHEEVCSDFEDYSHGNVVNSPRMGVCAYEGGSIDKKRDGVWKK